MLLTKENGEFLEEEKKRREGEGTQHKTKKCREPTLGFSRSP